MFHRVFPLFFAAFVTLAQTPPAPPAAETKGMPPRASAGDYQVHATAGTLSIGAEFKGHSMPTLQGTLTNEEYVAVELGLFGAKEGDKTKITITDFSLRVNGKKGATESVPWGAIAMTLKDPEWEPDTPTEPSGKKSKTAINSSGKEGRTDLNQPVVEPKVPVEVRRAMTARVRKVSMPEGERTLPVAGLLYFRYTGKDKGIHSAELIYEGPAGKATIELIPQQEK